MNTLPMEKAAQGCSLGFLSAVWTGHPCRRCVVGLCVASSGDVRRVSVQGSSGDQYCSGPEAEEGKPAYGSAMSPRL